MNTLNLCPMCGSPAEISSSGVLECYGWEWQTITIECTDTSNQHCGMGITVQADQSNLNNAWQATINFWNKITKH